MKYNSQDRLENYVEQHRADFDWHEPRPELWAALEKQLHGESTSASEPVMSVLMGGEEGRQLSFSESTGQPVVTKRRVWAERYSIAAALAVVILAAGLGEAWKSGRVAEERGAVTYTAAVANEAAVSPYLAAAGELTSSSVGQNTNARLDTAVRGMETYYASQLTDRKAELSQLAPDAASDWTRELVELDSSYQQLKRELPRHPQPEVVLTAMNRNLQIRLDILDQQLALRGPGETALREEARGEYALADSRQQPTTLRHDE